jgi:hypothetical protein
VKRTKITSVDRVSSPSKKPSQGGKTFDPTNGTGEQEPEGGDGTSAGQDETQPKPEEKKKGPGQRTLASEDELSGEYVDKIEKQVNDALEGKGAEWNIGGIPPRPGMGEGEGEPISIGQPQQQVPGGDERIWVDPDTLDKEIDEANRRGEEAERIADADSQEKEERTTDQKTSGGKGKGRGRVRDRIAVERLSQTDWASIFKTRLTAYSNERAKYLPWNRRFVSSPTLGRKIGSKVQQRDVLPELNVLLDTSSSLSYRELGAMLGEISNALEAAKVKTLNVFMWHHQPYQYKSFTDVTKKNFNQVLDWVQEHWQGGGNDEVALYNEIVKKGKAKNFTISLTDAYLDDHMKEGPLKQAWTKALDPKETIFAICYPNRSISYDNWLSLADRMPGQKIPVFLDTKKFR